jgi:MFS family permease
VLIALAALVPRMGLFGFALFGFALFGMLKVGASFLEATDPATLPLIGDWWPVEVRAKRISIFNAAAGIGAIVALASSGIIIDDFGWRWAFLIWLPVALVGAILIRRQVEPERGIQDALYAESLEGATQGAEHDRVVELVEHDAGAAPAAMERGAGGADGPHRFEIVRTVFRVRSWRRVAVGLAVTGIMGDGLGAWGLPYFQRTYHLSAAKAGGLAPVIGAGAFVGVLGGGFLSDRLLKRGFLRARVFLTGFGFISSGAVYILAFTTSRLLIAAPLLALGSTLATLPTGPQFAALMDVTPAPLRSQAAAAANVLQACGSIGPAVVGLASWLIGDLRLALMVVSPFYILGGLCIYSAMQSYVEDVAVVVAEAKVRTVERQ